MRLFLRTTLLGLSILSRAFGAGDERVSAPKPVKNYAVSFFSDEGYPRVRVQGGSADLSDTAHIRLGEMALTLYSGDADRTIDTVLIAPIAILTPETEVVTGPATVRLERRDVTVQGEDWSYEHQERRIHIRRKAHVVFKTGLANILK
ncbi:hypothetical protein [Synoicihabitans lomoniglobus]|uniref:LPS export ABC transporter periplasmic protein LptC n=1 Tax=Synoicihabitans lomoniglobus TaxID=2909285 RepID=A0AAF0CPY2_9BACT|nr:hypothetical protein [Opitutaceae bacterium LMO-M01]WED65887.1 hypothetical protein PXH66_03370 [Opitutaceae bacterium LMO-M01]